MNTDQISVEHIRIPPAGRRFAFVRAGTGGPPVVFETGLGAEAAEWEPVIRAVRPWTTVLRYDRANRGASDPAPKPRTVGDLAADLHALLVTASVPRPVVLVGHSLGGWIVRQYAASYPSDVAGLVLVDPMHPNQFERTGPLFFPPTPGEPEARTQMRRFWLSGWRDPARNPEGIDFPASQREAQAIETLGAIPMIVLTAGAYLQDAPPGLAGQAQAARLQAEWWTLHAELAQQSQRAQHILVESSGHFVQRDQPEVIVAAVQEMLQALRAGD